MVFGLDKMVFGRKPCAPTGNVLTGRLSVKVEWRFLWINDETDWDGVGFVGGVGNDADSVNGAKFR
jgi:hypothetical protein